MSPRRTAVLPIITLSLAVSVMAAATGPATAAPLRGVGQPGSNLVAPAAGEWTPAPRPTNPMNTRDARLLDRAIEDALANSYEGTHGAWVGVWSPTKGVRVQAYGDANDDGRGARIADHNFLGSVTKTVTATAVLQQVAAGRLRLSDTVAQVHPELAAEFPAIADLTVDQLLGMRSGLPDYANEPRGVLPKIVADPDRLFTPRQLIAIGLAANTIQPPGTPGYSTTNYIILGEILRKVTGKPVRQVLDGVFGQAGMANSALPAPGQRPPRPRSDGYIGAAGAGELSSFGVPGDLSGTDVSRWNLSWGRAGGGAYSTIEDLGRWGALGLGTALLPKTLGDRRIAAAKGNPLGYGLGLFVDRDGVLSHSGQVLGWESFVSQNSRTGEVIAVMVNSTSGLSDVTSAVEAFLGK